VSKKKRKGRERERGGREREGGREKVTVERGGEREVERKGGR